MHPAVLRARIFLLGASHLRHFTFHRADQATHWHRALHLTWVSDNPERVAGCWQHRRVPSPSVPPPLRRILLPGRPTGLPGSHLLPTRRGHSHSWIRKWLPLLQQRCTVKEDSPALSLGPCLQTFIKSPRNEPRALFPQVKNNLQQGRESPA